MRKRFGFSLWPVVVRLGALVLLTSVKVVGARANDEEKFVFDLRSFPFVPSDLYLLNDIS